MRTYSNRFECFDANEPELYNKDGFRVRMFFLRDVHGQHCPHGGGSPRLLFDRFDCNLKTHFYSHMHMRETCGKPDNIFGWLIESQTIVPEDYAWALQHRSRLQEFDAVFTFNDALLDRLPNALFAPGGSTWYQSLQDDAYLRKTKNISMVSTAKASTPLQLWRVALAKELKLRGLADTFGTFDGGERIPNKEVSLTDYRYAVAVENSVEPYYFTEKVLDCFASMTVPIYLGATEIGRFFNPDGIICLKPDDLGHMDKVLAQCSEKDYEQRLDAVRDNYRRLVKSYLSVENFLYDKYFVPRPGKKFIAEPV